MGFAGFDVPQIQSLAGQLASAAPGTHSLHARLVKVLFDAQGDLGGKPATLSPRLAPLADQYGGAQRGLPGSLQRELDDTAASMRRRVTQLGGMEKLKHAGYPVSDSSLFLDEAPPDPKKIDAAVKKIHDHEHDHVVAKDMYLNTGGDDIYDAMSGLTTAELNAVLGKLSDDDLAQMNIQLSPGQGPGGDGGLSLKTANLLLAKASPENLTRVKARMPGLEPEINAEHTKNLHYGPVPGNLFGQNGVDVPNDLVQGQDGDCWFLASLGAVAYRDPQFFPQHIKENPNGTYTVLLYKDGKPTPVTVDGDLPQDSSGNTAYAQTPNNTKWVAIYEKAYAQLNGGYGAIEGGYGDRGMHDVTGLPTDKHDADDSSLADVKRMIAQGHAVTTGSNSDKFLFWGGDEPMDHNKIITSHEYTVERVTDDQPPKIVLRNPWGSGGTFGSHHAVMPAEITLTEDEWHTYFDEVSYTKTRA